MTAALTRTSPAFDDVAASLLAEAAIEHAKSIDRRVGVVVVDASGEILATRRQANSYLSTLSIAESKAFTAVNFGVDTHVMSERLNAIEYAIHIAQADPRLMFVKGGCPIGIDGVLVGAIGVSGASADEDLACAQAAIKKWEAR